MLGGCVRKACFRLFLHRFYAKMEILKLPLNDRWSFPGKYKLWGDLKPVLVPIMVTIVVTTVLVMGVSGRTAQFVLKKEEKKDE